MKTVIKLIFLMAILTTGCSAQKNLLENEVNAAGNKEALQDSVLIKLQSENDLVIAYAVENFAWVKSIHYKIIAQHNSEWSGYDYHKNMMLNNAGSPTTITVINVDKSACDSLLNFINESKAWTIKGDSGDTYCTNGKKICNIFDAAGARLWLITKSAYIDPSYYAPQFFQKCCPEDMRGLFVSVTEKIASIVGEIEE